MFNVKKIALVILCSIPELLYSSEQSLQNFSFNSDSDNEDRKYTPRQPTLSEFHTMIKDLPTNRSLLDTAGIYQYRAFANGNLSWNDFEYALDAWISMKSKGPLSEKNNWSETDSGKKQPSQNFFEKKYSERLPTYVQKIVCPVNSEICIRGDLHGDITSLLQQLQWMQEQNIIDESFTIIKENYKILFLGDYVDRGSYGSEVIYTILRLMLANPENVIAVRGNHEEIDINRRDGFALEVFEKFDDTRGKKAKAIARIYDFLPSAVYLGYSNEKSYTNLNFIQCCHGGFELGYNPNFFLSEPLTNYQQVDYLNVQDYINMLKLRVASKSNKGAERYLEELERLPMTNRNIPFDPSVSGFLWNDFDVENKQQIIQNTKRGTGLIFGKTCSEDILQTMRSYHHKVTAVIRGHQHSLDPECPMMQRLIKDHGVHQAWTTDETSPQRKLSHNAILTMNVAPDSIYGLSVDFENNTFMRLQPNEDDGDWLYIVENLPNNYKSKD